MQLEELKLFSTAERLGLLSTLERLLVSDPAAVSSLALVPLVGTIGELPHLFHHNRSSMSRGVCIDPLERAARISVYALEGWGGGRICLVAMR